MKNYEKIEKEECRRKKKDLFRYRIGRTHCLIVRNKASGRERRREIKVMKR